MVTQQNVYQKSWPYKVFSKNNLWMIFASTDFLKMRKYAQVYCLSPFLALFLSFSYLTLHLLGMCAHARTHTRTRTRAHMPTPFQKQTMVFRENIDHIHIKEEWYSPTHITVHSDSFAQIIGNALHYFEEWFQFLLLVEHPLICE